MSTDKNNVRYLSNRSLDVHEKTVIAEFEKQQNRDSWKQAVRAVSVIFAALIIFAIGLGVSISLQQPLANVLAGELSKP